jgi:hypothetical protein
MLHFLLRLIHSLFARFSMYVDKHQPVAMLNQLLEGTGVWISSQVIVRVCTQLQDHLQFAIPFGQIVSTSTSETDLGYVTCISSNSCH